MLPACQWCGSWRDVRPVRVEGRFQWHICARCFAIWRETGERPDMRSRGPAPGPITGIPLSPALMRDFFTRRT